MLEDKVNEYLSYSPNIGLLEGSFRVTHYRTNRHGALLQAYLLPSVKLHMLLIGVKVFFDWDYTIYNYSTTYTTWDLSSSQTTYFGEKSDMDFKSSTSIFLGGDFKRFKIRMFGGWYKNNWDVEVNFAFTLFRRSLTRFKLHSLK